MNLPQLMSDYSSEKNSTADFQINKGQIGLDNNLKKERNETKQRGVSEIDDSFEIFVPLKVKNNNKKLNYTSPNKLKKKTVSSNRISPYFSARKTNRSSQEDKDIQIALARSLADISPSNSEDSVLKAVLNKKKSKENSDFLKSLTNKTKKSGVKSLLFRRTDEERQSILTKKVAIVLLEKENISDECFRKCEIELISSVLEGFWDKNCTLWEHSKTQFNNIEDFYVTALQKFIEKPLITSDMPEMNASEENENTEKSSNILDLNTEDENFQLEETCESVSFELDKGNNHELSATDLSESITVNRDKFITDSLNVLSDDLFSLFDSSELSDIKVILKTDQILPCHKFMLRIRCPSLLVQNDPSKVSNDLDFTQYSSVATRAFFKYIYTGKIEFMYCLAKEEKSDLYILAKKYNLEFLKQFVSTAFRTESFNVYSQSTCSPPHDSPIGSPYSSQGHKDIVINELSPDLSITNSSSGLKFLNDKDYQTANESYKYPVNNEPSCSALHISRNDNISDNSFTYFSNDNSSYDIFNDEIKTPCNSSVLLMNSSQTKRRLDYTNVNEAKKVCSEPISTNVKNSSEIIILDSDSDEACLDLKTNSVSNTLNMPVSFSEVKFNLLASENLFENSNKKFNFNEPKSSTIANNEERITYKVTVVGSGQNVSSPLRNSISPVITTPLYTNTTPQKHKNSIDKYFEASFPEINENFDNIEAPFSQSTPEQSVLRNSLKNSLTPIQKIIIDNATPKPDYDSMITPDLKAELKKYGLKPDLGRKKAQALLQYIYEQIHPIKSELPRYQSPIPSTSKERTPSPSGVINVDSDDSRMNSENDFEYEEYLFNCSRERNECSTNQIGSNLRRIVIKFIKSNSELFSNVVLFRPLLLKKFYNTLKDHGVHCSLYELMDVLDDLCVNYHVEKKETTQKRRFKKKKIKIKQT